MNRLLLLTKNILAEQEIVHRLQCLNYEVFCSATTLELINHVESTKEVLQLFPMIIFSETISSAEVNQILPKLIQDEKIIFRKVDTVLSENEQCGMEGAGILDWFHSNASIEELREKIPTTVEKYPYIFSADEGVYDIHSEKAKIESMIASLSNNEFKVFQKLRQEYGTIVSREELCELIWGELTQSRMVQLSSIVKNIRLKLEVAGNEGEVIKTVWRRGYKLRGL
ncbi:transcriptional regulator [Enterococcus florum]|uniref:Transcriptional regulator n=1 Tax=Enterococcus florum TaxID=2480627 RepID=A0A4P5PAK2_9ENTE|nr:helix-turn-helix domain-containing protein [Enterococcus florum]GCF93281.1 transcriptional regulator [Enterococcus florum]